MGEAAVMVTAENIQVHGAVGFTWDSRRRRALQAGEAERRARRVARSWHRSRVADLVLDAGLIRRAEGERAS